MLLQQAGSAKEKVSGKTFEEVIGELDEEINKYDSKDSMAIRVDVNTEKENVGDQHTINEASMPCSPSHATNISIQLVSARPCIWKYSGAHLGSKVGRGSLGE